MVFQKKVCLGTLLDPGGGGLPNPTESTMWGRGSSGRLLRRDPMFEPTNGAAARADQSPRGLTVSPAAGLLSSGLVDKLLSRGGGSPGGATHCPDRSWGEPAVAPSQ